MERGRRQDALTHILQDGRAAAQPRLRDVSRLALGRVVRDRPLGLVAREQHTTVDGEVAIRLDVDRRAHAVAHLLVDKHALEDATLDLLHPRARDAAIAGGSATVSLSVPPVVGAAPATIMYTLDGSDPAGHTARRYAQPLRISETTALRAVAVRDGRAAAQQRNATFVLA